MVNLKFSAFLLFTLCLIQYCVCESNETSCTIQDKIATCESIIDFKTLQDTNITKLIVRSDKLQRINKDDLALYVNLEEIDLSDCALEEIDANAFVTLSKLHKINLSGNKKLKTVTITSETITCLNVSNTGIEDLGDMFKHLPNLHNLDLSDTQIKDFSQLEHLEHLAKLVVSKTNETLELCSLLSVKELTLIGKDNNGTEIPLDCKTKKEDETKTEIPEKSDNKEETNSTEIPLKKDEEVTEAPIIASTIAPTIEAENTSKVAPEVVPEIAPKIAQNITQKIEETTVANEVNKIEVPKLLHESSANENEATTVIILKEEKDKYATNKTENEAVTEATLKNEGETMKKEENEEPKQEKEAPKEENEETKKEVETPKPEVNIPKEEQKTAQIQAKNKDPSEKPQVVLDASDDVILPSTEKASQANGVNIVLGIILCVMVVGAVGFGFKYWKNRRSGYTHANTHDHEDEEKELQTIVAHRTDPEQN